LPFRFVIPQGSAVAVAVAAAAALAVAIAVAYFTPSSWSKAEDPVKDALFASSLPLLFGLSSRRDLLLQLLSPLPLPVSRRHPGAKRRTL
jgi:hypothetical protein